VSGLLKGAIGKRVAGDKPSPVAAAVAGLIAGAAAAVLTYKVLRS
jgi:hypothetical protein